MTDSATIIRDGDTAYRLQITHRDWMLVNGPGFNEGPIFVAAFGIFENATLARTLPKRPLVHREGQTLFDAASKLLKGITRDFDLMRYDYSCQVGDSPKQFGGGQGISVNGRPGILSLRPKGYCSIRLVDRKPAEIIDLRSTEGFMTDAGPITLYRRKADSHWLEILPPLIVFLGKRRSRSLSLEHVDRVR